jgi:hypothetical protein
MIGGGWWLVQDSALEDDLGLPYSPFARGTSDIYHGKDRSRHACISSLSFLAGDQTPEVLPAVLGRATTCDSRSVHGLPLYRLF